MCHDSLFCDVMDVMIVPSSSVVILVLATQENNFSCFSLLVNWLCVFVSRYLTHRSLLRIFVYLKPLHPFVMFLMHSGFMVFFPVKNNAEDKLLNG